MKKFHTCFLILCVNAPAVIFAQKITDAENAFADYARENTVRSAFLKYMDSNAVLFQNGAIINGHHFWRKQKESPGKLLWQPSYSATAASGDMGFTTGPFEYREALNDTVEECGQFSSIWIRDSQHQWKLLADLGINYKENLFGKQSLKQFTQLTPAGSDSIDIYQLEEKFIRSFSTEGKNAFKKAILNNSRINVDGYLPATDSLSIQYIFNQLPANMLYNPASGKTSFSKDMAYIYGTITTGDKKGNYLRVWVHTREGWKILLQVIKW